MAAVHQWAQRCSQLLFVGAVLVIGLSTGLRNENNNQHFNSYNYDHLQHIKDGAELLTFTRFTELSGSPSTLNVGFSSKNSVDGITDLILVVIKIYGDGSSEQNWVSSSDPVTSIAAEEVIHNFSIDPRLPTIEDGDQVSLVVVARAGEKAKAAGEFTFKYVQSTSASLAWVGAAKGESTAFLRVDPGETTSQVSIGSDCTCDGPEPCYCKQANVPENLEICVEVTGTGNGGIELKPLQCDGNIMPTDFVEIKPIENAELHTTTDNKREFEISATYSGSTTVQMLFYKEGDTPSKYTTCDTSSQSCTAIDPPVEITFHILLVALDGEGAVVESNDIAFDDYIIDVKQISSDVVEVSWSGSAATNYEVIIDASDAFTKTVGNGCIDDDCKAYFVKTKSSLKCTVYKTEDQTMKSSRSLDMNTSPTQATFTSINKLDSGTISVDITSDTEITSGDVISLVVITASDGDGTEKIYETNPAMMRVDSNYKFPVALPLSDGTHYFVLVAHQGSDVTIAGTTNGVINEFSTKLAWVGAAYSDDNNDATLRINTADKVSFGGSCSCESSNSPCYCVHTELKKDDIVVCSDFEDDVHYCDKSIEVKPYAEITFENAELHTKSDDSREIEISATYSGTSEAVQMLFYKEGETQLGPDYTSCDPNAQPCKGTPPDEAAFNILMVALDGNGAVVESKDIGFEDYLVNVKKLSSGAVEVTWSGSTPNIISKSGSLTATTKYEVLIDDTGAPFKKTVGNQSVGGNCKAYFVKTTSPTLKCTVYIKDDDKIKSSRSLDMSNDPTEATFTSINKLDSAKISVHVQSESTINPEDAVSLVVIAVSSEDGIEHIYEEKSMKTIDSVESEYQFEVSVEPSEDSTYFILVAHQGDGDVTIAGTAAGVIKEFNTKLGWVGAAYSADNNDATLRISTTEDLSFGASCPCASADSPCYCVHTELKEDDIVVCSSLEDSVQYCDKFIGVNSFSDIPTITKSKLMYPLNDEPFYEFEVASVKHYELLSSLGDIAHVNPCDAPVCNITPLDLPEDSKIYSILAVTVDDGDAVLQSKEFLFEDFKVRVEVLTGSMLWVVWESAEGAKFVIDCSPETEGNPDPEPTRMECGAPGEDCLVIFNGLSCSHTLVYTGEVTKNMGSYSNTVVGQVLMECPNADVHITRVIHEHRSSDSSTMTVCFTGEGLNSTDIAILKLLIYDQQGYIHQAQGPKQDEEENEYCFMSVSLADEIMNLSESLSFVIYPTKEAAVQLYILDISINQVESLTLKTTWKSKNNPTNYSILFDDQAMKLDHKDCLGNGECVHYLHLKERQRETGRSITVIEQGAVIQEVRLDTPELIIIDSLSVSTPVLRYDDHIRVCFNKPSHAHHYELGLEHEGVAVEAALPAQLDLDNEGNPCLVSSKSVSLGSRVDLWALVAAYDNSGSIISSGSTNWETILLSSDRWVQAAITENTTIISSWQVIDDSHSIDKFQLTLKSETGSQDTPVPSHQTSYKVRDIATGSYSVCVRAVSSIIQSKEVCSGIITIIDNSDIEIPTLETTQPKASGEDSVTITWNHQDDVTAYVVLWMRSTSAVSQTKLLKPLNSIALLNPIKNGGDGSEEYSFKIIPASRSSFEISGLDKGEWNVCLSGVKDGNVGGENCQKSDVDPDNFKKIKAPDNLRIEESILKWDAINDINKYFVEWLPHSSGETGGHLETPGTSFNLEDKLNPGEWSFTVRGVTSIQLGDAQIIMHTLEGINIRWSQVGSRSLLVEWQDPENSNTIYKVSYYQGDDNSKTIMVICNFEITGFCQVYLLDIEVDTSKDVSLEVARKDEDVKREINIQMKNLKDTTQLEQTMKSSNKATVSWTEVDGADCYNVSLYRDQHLVTQKWQTLPRSVTFEMAHIEDCTVRVQPCINKKYCVDGKQIQLKIVNPKDSGDLDGLLLVSILGGVLGVAIVASVIIVVVYKYKINKREAIEKQSRSDARGDGARRLSTVSILGQSQLNNDMELRHPRPTYEARRPQQGEKIGSYTSYS